MKYLVVVLLMFSNIYIIAQDKDSLFIESNSLEMKGSHFSISVGGSLPILEFDRQYLGLEYRFRLSENIYLPIEGGLLNNKFGGSIQFSTSIRAYLNIHKKTNVFGQVGYGLLFLWPTDVFNATLGINHKIFDVGFRFFYPRDYDGFPLFFLIIGVEL